jgi:DNA-binding NarL/FixJ family response regulator
MNILIADDHALIREGIKLIIRRHYADAQVTEVANYSDALKQATGEVDWDLILLDLNMPGKQAKNGIMELRECLPCAPIVVISASQDPNDVKISMDAGAKGYVPKSATNEVLHCAIELVLSGGLYLPAELMSDTYYDSDPNDARPYEHQVHVRTNGHELRDDFTPTPRQKDVLRLLLDGKTNKQIGVLLGLSEGTVRTHVSNILKGLGANNRTEAVRIASQQKNW